MSRASVYLLISELPMRQSSPDTIITAEPTHWLDTQMGDVFAPHVRVQISWADIEFAVQRGAVAPAHAHALWAEWADPGNPRRVHRKSQSKPAAISAPRFDITHTLYYFGGLLAIGAMSLFMNLSWQMLGPWGGGALALGYMVAALRVASYLKAKGLNVPAGILATLAVVLVPLVVWSVQVGLGLWPGGASEAYRDYHHRVDWRFLTLEFATLAAGVVMLWWYRLPFMVMPGAITLWYMSMDMAALLMQAQGFDWTFARNFSMLFGMGTCALAVWVDLRCRLADRPEYRQDFAYWLYTLGAIMFWGGLSMHDSSSELAKLGYAAINVVLILWGAMIGRRVFTVLGGLGVAGYLGYLSYRVFKDSLLFPFALTLLGLAVVALGVWWQRREQAIRDTLVDHLPEALRPLTQDFNP
jgi:hypothetical protein